MPLGTIYCHEIEPSRKETLSIPKGLEHIQIVIDTEKFHNVLFFEKEKAGGSFEFPSGRVPLSFEGVRIFNKVNYSLRTSV